MKKILAMVTITGADDQTNYEDMKNFFHTYPYTEFGILLSRTQQGNGRFPSEAWLKGLAERFSRSDIMFSGHLCGSYVKDFLSGKWIEDLIEIHPALPSLFNRWQINTHGEPAKFSEDVGMLISQLEKLEQNVIFQWDNVNDDMIKKLCQAFPDNTSALVDLSHGAGILPDKWERPNLDVPVGFAGGLSPNNVIRQMQGILEIMSQRPGEKTWIDAETHLRVHDVFDLDLAEDFVRNAGNFVDEIIEGAVRP